MADGVQAGIAGDVPADERELINEKGLESLRVVDVDEFSTQPKGIAARRVLGHIDLTDERIGLTIDRPGPCTGRDIGAGSATSGIDQRQQHRIMFH